MPRSVAPSCGFFGCFFLGHRLRQKLNYPLNFFDIGAFRSTPGLVCSKRGGKKKIWNPFQLGGCFHVMQLQLPPSISAAATQESSCRLNCSPTRVASLSGFLPRSHQ